MITENKKQLCTRQICLFMIAFLPVTKLFMMPSVVAGFSREDMWISILINLSLDFLTIMAVTFTCKKTNLSFFELLELNFGKIGSKIILCFYYLLFFLKAVLPLEEQKDYIEYTLYTLVPTIFYFMPFFVVAFFLCMKKLRAVGRLADVCWIITLIGFIILIVLSFSNADFFAILPIGANGVSKIVKGAYSSFVWFSDAVYLLFFVGEFNYRKNDGKKIFLSYAVYALMVLLFAIIFYAIFTSIAFRQRFALTEISKYTTVINNIGRLDFLGIMMILLANVFSLSLPLFFCCRILNHVCGFKRRYLAPLITITAHITIMIFLSEYYATIEKTFLAYGGLLFFILGNFLPILTVFLNKKGEKHATND